MAHLLGIDIGTTNTKIIIFSENGDIIEERAFPTPFLK
jgi:sugar (pentulose or hexulose) kinase